MTKETVIPKLIPVFRQYGYEGTTLSMLAKATGLGKASLYHYFPQGKKGMANAVINYIASDFNQTVIKPLKNSGTPDEKIQRMGQGLAEFYDSGHNNCFLAIMSLGEADNLFKTQIRQRLEVWIDTLAQILIEAGIGAEQALTRSQNAVVEIQGALVLVRILDDQAIFGRIVSNLPKKLLHKEEACLT